MTEDVAYSSAITRHPAASVYDRFFARALPEVAAVAHHKNIVLLDGEQEAVLHYALKATGRKTMRQALHGRDDACWSVSLALDHALDVLAMKRLIRMSDSICQKAPQGEEALIAKAEECLKQRFANDQTRTCAIWRNPVEELTDYVRSVFAGPSITLAEAATVRATVRGASASRTSGGALS